jgi:hypothetical protein
MPEFFGRVIPHSGGMFLDYCHFMSNKKLFFKTNKAGFVLSAVLLVTLTGCVGYVDGPGGGAYVAPPVVQVGFAAEDDYVYYPSYGVYYSNSRHEYAYPEGGRWIERGAPRGVSVDVLRASPSVRMDFHDSPANHHAEIARQYPKNWKPSGSNQGQKENRKDDGRDNNNGR